MDGWQRLWVLVKWLAAIAAGIYSGGMLHQASLISPEAEKNLGIGLLLGAVLAGMIVFLFLSALEWVYRGFRPLPAITMGTAQLTQPLAPEPTQEQRPALPDPAHQQNT